MKKKSGKKLLAMITLLLSFFISAVFVYAEDGISTCATEYLNYGNWIGYENEDGTFTVAGCRALEEYVSDGILTIPSEIEGMTVTTVKGYTGILSYYFDIMSPELVETLVLPDTVTYIEDYTFKEFVNLTKVVLPNNENLETGYKIFGDNIENIADVTSRCTFSGDTSIWSFSNMTVWTIHEGETYISVSEKSELLTVNLPSTVRTLSFYKNPKLSTVNCTKSLDEISILQTEGCPELCIPVHVYSTEDYTASGILAGKFANSGVTEIYIEDDFLTADYMNKDTFRNCPNLKGIYVVGDEGNFYSIDGVLFWNNDLFAYPAAKSTAANYTVPSFVTCIYVYAFDGCAFTSITIPEDINAGYYWDSAISESYLDEEGNWLTRKTKLLTNLPNTKLRVIKGSPACYGWLETAENMASQVGAASADQIEFYLGSIYTISYELDGGTNHPDNPSSYQAGTDVITLHNPTKEGYKFLGWKRNDISYGYENTTSFSYNSAGYDYNYIFTAVWEEDVPITFTDVMDPGAYYYGPVYWAVEKEITSGISDTEFGPDQGCTRGQVVTFLWRAAGQPSATSTVCNFIDVTPSAYYYEAVLWAVENNITDGLTETQFAPDVKCTRGQIVTFLWRAKGEPEATVEDCVMTDVAADAYYYKAVIWAIENNVTSGVSDTEFGPDQGCTRGQVVTFLQRAYE